MGIYLPNMEMPRNGQMLVIFPDGTSYVCFNGMRERLTQTTAIPVPPHGRLIDADALIDDMANMIPWAIESPEEIAMVDGLSAGYEAVKAAPTIIPAEPSEEQREYEAQVEAVQYCEMYEPTYDPETGAL